MCATVLTWTDDRIELLQRLFARGRTCREMADEIGVSRNAVIGKLSRLNLARGTGRRARRAERPADPNVRRLRGALVAMRAAAPRAVEHEAVDHTHRCSLMELGRDKCRWPIDSTEPAADVWYCGSTPVNGLPYCAPHARIAYRATRQRGLFVSVFHVTGPSEPKL